MVDCLGGQGRGWNDFIKMFRVRISGRGPKGQWWPPSRPAHINNPTAQVRTISVFRILCASCLASCVFHICHPTSINNPRAQVRTISLFRILCFLFGILFICFLAVNWLICFSYFSHFLVGISYLIYKPFAKSEEYFKYCICIL